ncbi:MAG: YkgJ family cysteine cluster protein [Lachnospiraceae bacterium]|nr:YkgJ family cysteine cluster protein [Lachnospiraceae bacterium]
MLREVDLSSVSDGKIYHADDMAALGCHDCEGCSSCCHDMEGLFLDPYDVFMLSSGTNRSFESLLSRELTLDHHGGLFLPKMKMDDARKACHFLNEQGRCSVHAYRPGICRIFPLGRNYEDGDFSYFLQKDECAVKKRYKVKIKKWIEIPDYRKYHAFVLKWHDFSGKVGEKLPALTEESIRSVVLYVLRVFYEMPYRGSDFFQEFDERMEKAEQALSALFNA